MTKAVAHGQAETADVSLPVPEAAAASGLSLVLVAAGTLASRLLSRRKAREARG